MGNCQGYCNSCGDESTQIKTLDASQIKHSIREKDNNYAHGSFQTGMGRLQQDNYVINSALYGVQEGEEVDDEGRVTRGPVTLKNGSVYTG